MAVKHHQRKILSRARIPPTRLRRISEAIAVMSVYFRSGSSDSLRVADDQRADDTRHPAKQGEQENDDYGSAAFIQNRQRRQDNA